MVQTMWLVSQYIASVLRTYTCMISYLHDSDSVTGFSVHSLCFENVDLVSWYQACINNIDLYIE